MDKTTFYDILMIKSIREQGSFAEPNQGVLGVSP